MSLIQFSKTQCKICACVQFYASVRCYCNKHFWIWTSNQYHLFHFGHLDPQSGKGHVSTSFNDSLWRWNIKTSDWERSKRQFNQQCELHAHCYCSWRIQIILIVSSDIIFKCWCIMSQIFTCTKMRCISAKKGYDQEP